MEPFLNWIKSPFDPSMSAARWFLFFGLILIISTLWHYTIRALANL